MCAVWRANMSPCYCLYYMFIKATVQFEELKNNLINHI